MKNNTNYNNIDEYINLFSDSIKEKLQQLRHEIKSVIPETTEVISYNMPAFKLKEVLVYFAAYKNHIGFYPTPSAIVEFKKELKDYKTSKGAIQFPLNKPLPFELIKKIVEYRIKSSK
jgi:uncharacterized protein YdhG (YjbR/CyaY superfamily)